VRNVKIVFAVEARSVIGHSHLIVPCQWLKVYWCIIWLCICRIIIVHVIQQKVQIRLPDYIIARCF